MPTLPVAWWRDAATNGPTTYVLVSTFTPARIYRHTVCQACWATGGCTCWSWPSATSSSPMQPLCPRPPRYGAAPSR